MTITTTAMAGPLYRGMSIYLTLDEIGARRAERWADLANSILKRISQHGSSHSWDGPEASLGVHWTHSLQVAEAFSNNPTVERAMSVVITARYDDTVPEGRSRGKGMNTYEIAGGEQERVLAPGTPVEIEAVRLRINGGQWAVVSMNGMRAEAKMEVSASYGTDKIARGLHVYVGIDTHTEKIPALLAGTATARDILDIMDPAAGIWWGIMGQFGDLADFEDYAYSDDLLADTYEDLEGGEVSIVLVAKRPTRDGQPWDPEHHNPHDPLMGNSFLEDGEQIDLVEIRYDAGKGWHSIPVSGQRVTAGANGDLPAGIRFTYSDLPSGGGRIQAWDDEGATGSYVQYGVGMLSWNQRGVISWVQANEGYERKGLATRMLQEARKHRPDIRHSRDRSDAAKAWIKSMASETAKTAGPMNDFIPVRFRSPVPPTHDQMDDPRKVVFDRPALEDIDDLSGDLVNALHRALDVLQTGKAEIDAKVGPLRGVYTVRLTPKWRAAFYLGADSAWHVFWVGPHNYDEATKRWTHTAAAVTAMPVGPPPAGVRYLFTSNRPKNPTTTYCMLGAFLGETCIGYLTWGISGRQVQSIWVSPEHRRRRIAETMWTLAHHVDPNIQHHGDRTDAGDVWTNAVTPGAAPRTENTTEPTADKPNNLVVDRLLSPRSESDVFDLTSLSTTAKTALPSWRDYGTRPEQAEALIVPDQGRARGNSYEVFLYGQPHARRTSLADAQATVEAIYGDQQWIRLPGDHKPHHDPVHGPTTMFNDAPYYLVVWRLPRLGVTAAKDQSVSPSEHGDPRLQDAGVTVSKTERGQYYVHTHRARSKYYDSVKAIPQKDIDYIRSTGSMTDDIYAHENQYRRDGMIRRFDKEQATDLAMRALGGEGFPQGVHVEVEVNGGLGKSRVGWYTDTNPPTPVIDLDPRMIDELTVLHECAHIIRNGPAMAGRSSDEGTETHDAEFVETFRRLATTYGSFLAKKFFRDFYPTDAKTAAATGLEDVVAEFAQQHRQDLLDPSYAHERCVVTSQAFAALCERHGVEAEVISGMKMGEMPEFPGMRMMLAGHFAVLVGDTVYDWTARQFEPQAAVPKVVTETEWRAEWTKPGKTAAPTSRVPDANWLRSFNGTGEKQYAYNKPVMGVFMKSDAFGDSVGLARDALGVPIPWEPSSLQGVIDAAGRAAKTFYDADDWASRQVAEGKGTYLLLVQSNLTRRVLGVSKTSPNGPWSPPPAKVGDTEAWPDWLAQSRSNPKAAWERICKDVADAQPPGFVTHPLYDPAKVTKTVIYRGISLGVDADPERSAKDSGGGVGTSWTLDLNAAKAMAERGGAGFVSGGMDQIGVQRVFPARVSPASKQRPVVLRAVVDLTKDGVALFTDGRMYYVSEQEVNVSVGTEIKVTGIVEAKRIFDAREKAEAERLWDLAAETLGKEGDYSASYKGHYQWPPFRQTNLKRTASLYENDYYRGITLTLESGDTRVPPLLSALAQGATNVVRDRVVEMMGGGTGMDRWTGEPNRPRSGAGTYWTTDEGAAWNYALSSPEYGKDQVTFEVLLHGRLHGADAGAHEDGQGQKWPILDPGTPLDIVRIEADLPTRQQAQRLLDLLHSQGAWQDVHGMHDLDTWLDPWIDGDIQTQRYAWDVRMHTEARKA